MYHVPKWVLGFNNGESNGEEKLHGKWEAILEVYKGCSAGKSGSSEALLRTRIILAII